jgi:hypothetical protein
MSLKRVLPPPSPFYRKETSFSFAVAFTEKARKSETLSRAVVSTQMIGSSFRIVVSWVQKPRAGVSRSSKSFDKIAEFQQRQFQE